MTAQNLTLLAEGLPGVESVLTFVNEREVVSRLCLDYVKSVLHLYERHVKETFETQQRGVLPTEGFEPAANLVTMSQEWKLPDPSYYQIGRIILLRPSLVGKQIMSPGCSELDYADFSLLLWCDTVVHKGSTYSDRVGALVRSVDPEILSLPKPLEYETYYQ